MFYLFIDVVALGRMAGPPPSGGYVWSVRFAPPDINHDLYVSNGLCTIRLALQPLDDSKVRLQDAIVIYENVRSVTTR